MPKQSDDKLFILSKLSLFLLHLFSQSKGAATATIGICYGGVANNLPPPSTAVQILETNNISSVRLFNTDATILRWFSGTGISLMIGVPNELLPTLAAGPVAAAIKWLQANIFFHVPAYQVRYIAVGNEVFFKDTFYTPFVIPAILNLHEALQALALANSIKLSSPQAASVLSTSYPPSSASFDPYAKFLLLPLLQFLRDTQSPFMVNSYPYFSFLNNKPYISLDYALFGAPNPVQDGGLAYGNLFDASVDAFMNAMEREGFGGVPVVVSETGWPTSGGEAASAANALVYNQNVVTRALDRVGTPKRPGVGVEVYLFALFDENEKGGEEYERHFGIFRPDGLKAYDLTFN